MSPSTSQDGGNPWGDLRAVGRGQVPGPLLSPPKWWQTIDWADAEGDQATVECWCGGEGNTEQGWIELDAKWSFLLQSGELGNLLNRLRQQFQDKEGQEDKKALALKSSELKVLVLDNKEPDEE